MTRRDLLRLLLASAVAEAVDVEKLLWVPKPIVTVPEHITFGIASGGLKDHILTEISMHYASLDRRIWAEMVFPAMKVIQPGVLLHDQS